MTWSRLFRGFAGLVLCTSAAAQAAHIESVHQDLYVELDPATRELRVSAQIGFEGGGVARLGLGDGFAVESVAVDGDPIAVARSDIPEPGVYVAARRHAPDSGARPAGSEGGGTRRVAG